MPLSQQEFVSDGAASRSLKDKYQLAVSNVPRHIDFTTIKKAFEVILRPRGGPNQYRHIPFTLQLDPPDPKRPKDKNRGTGVIYLNDEKYAKFLAARVNEYPIKIGDYEVLFQRQDGSLSRALQAPYRRPAISREALQRKKKDQEALGHEVRVLSVQFGIEGRDRTSFSVEWEGDYNPNAAPKRGQPQNGNKSYAYLKFNEGREGENPRSLQIEISGHSQPDMFRITIPMNQIRSLENGWVNGMPFIMIRLYNPPSFETKPQYASLTGDPRKDSKHSWQRLGSLEPAHERVVAFASKVLRLVITPDPTHLDNFIKMSRFVRLPRLAISLHADIARGELFTRRRLDDVQAMSSKFPWAVKFQCETLLRNCLLLPWEILELKGELNRLVSIGTGFAEEVLKLFVVLVPNLYENQETALDCLRRAETECNNRGPYDEQSNRVIRKYGPEFEECFIRVAFGDEGGALYRHDWEVDNNPSVELESDEIEVIPDVEKETQIQYGDNEEIKPRKLLWTDGHGTISPDLADEIWQRLCELRPKRVKSRPETDEQVRPRAYQIRLGGYKGVVSVDYRLKGKRLIQVRPSMDKFDAPDSLGIEISEAFNKPSKMYLNRPLIMLLDTLGVKHSVFVKLQDEALEQSQTALNQPGSSAYLMETYELGKAFELPSLLARLSRYNLQELHGRDPFFRKLLSFSLYHVKRELKYHARIPGKPLRSEPIGVGPTVHPGDVQLVTAVGKPEVGSPYDIENLPNTVVFSVKGQRPLPSCLGGGDLDGDVYYLIRNLDLHPTKYEIAAAYDPSERHILKRPSTIKDVAEFVIQYMTHDTLGLIGINHLRLADQRPEGVLDKDCLHYAKLYSDAVDYPKTGMPVKIDGMPKPTDIPDWYCPESADPNNGDYYESIRALGVLFRAIQLGDPEPAPVDRPVNQEDTVRNALEEKVFSILNNSEVEAVDDHFFHQLFARFSYDLKYQCATHSLAQSANSRLNEEEVVLGTILGKTTALNESRKRRALTERLAKQSQNLVRLMKREIIGDRSVFSLPEQLGRAWTCLEVAWEMARANKFGKNSFSLIALTSVLDVLYEIDTAEVAEETL
ncbi:hypothetical protein FRC05_011675 [Tulasnella sp. 425]|nr:hypothetical protein FRC05_011675 [Tulasnella sp. 425]